MSEAAKRYVKSLAVVLSMLVVGNVLDAVFDIEWLSFSSGAAFLAGTFWGRQYP